MSVLHDPANLQDFEFVFSKILLLATTAAGLVCFVMLIIGGFRYLTSAGEPKQTAAARQTLTQAVIGLAVIIGAWFILLFIEYFTGVNVTTFEVPR